MMNNLTSASFPPPAEPVTDPDACLATTQARIQSAIEALESVIVDRAILALIPEELRTRLVKAAGEIYCPDVVQRRRLVKAKLKHQRAVRIAKVENVLSQTGIRRLRKQTVFTTPNIYPPAQFEQSRHNNGTEPEQVIEPQNCYICKKDYTDIHSFYDQLCPVCAELNFRKRAELADLRGRVALLTGGRVKIGYQAGIKLLRAGAHLIVTTRFPRDSAMRYAKKPDYELWGDRLEIFGLDLRHTPSVEAFCRHVMTKYQRLDFIINNACQTVRRPPDFYQHMMARETGSLRDLPEQTRRLLGAYEGLRGYQMLPAVDQVVRRNSAV